MHPEKKVAKAILQEPTVIVLGGKEYTIAPPSTGTIVKVSEIIAGYPEFKIPGKFSQALALAKNYAFAPCVLAALILGSRKMNEPAAKTKAAPVRKLGFITVRKNKEAVTGSETEYDRLCDVLMHDVSPAEVFNAMVEILYNRMETGFFFQTITFLHGQSITKPTKTTASGHLQAQC